METRLCDAQPAKAVPPSNPESGRTGLHCTPEVPPNLANRVSPYMGGIVKERKGVPLVINGPADHVHLLLSLPAGESIAALLRVLKTNSSRWLPAPFPQRRRFGR